MRPPPPVSGPASDARRAAVAARVRELEALFERIAATRMQGLPILHPGLRVAAVGFEATEDGAAAVGVLLTPWFMNLVWLPLGDVAGAPAASASQPATAVGVTRTRTVGQERFDFLGAHESGFGPFEACSLFSPMSEFADQATARATAEQVLLLLRTPPAPAEAATAATAAPADVGASRRALLFGRGATAPAGSR